MNKILMIIFAFVASPLFSQNAPSIIEFEAETMLILESDNITELEGNARLKRGNLDLNADKVVVYSRDGADGEAEFSHLEANGGGRAKTGAQDITSNSMTYDGNSEIATFVGNVVIKQGKNVARGDKAEVNTKTGIHRLYGPVKGTITGKLP